MVHLLNTYESEFSFIEIMCVVTEREKSGYMCCNYTCSCLSGFNGTHCEFDHRPCKLNTCLNGCIYILLENAKIILFL
jgi:hypothetical protein